MLSLLKHQLDATVSSLKSMVESTISAHIIPYRRHGHCVFKDIIRTEQTIDTVFDIGANVGSFTRLARARLGQPRIYSFEPVSATFQILKNHSLPKVEFYQLAFGSERGEDEICIEGDSTGFSFMRKKNGKTELVMIETVDDFATDHKIGQIDLLKIDTEGFDLRVLRGATRMLKQRRVKFIYVEVGFQKADKTHVLLREITDFLFPYGYHLFGLYEQHLNWKGARQLYFANACYYHQPE